jgi:hypothetical protein
LIERGSSSVGTGEIVPPRQANSAASAVSEKSLDSVLPLILTYAPLPFTEGAAVITGCVGGGRRSRDVGSVVHGSGVRFDA